MDNNEEGELTKPVDSTYLNTKHRAEWPVKGWREIIREAS